MEQLLSTISNSYITKNNKGIAFGNFDVTPEITRIAKKLTTKEELKAAKMYLLNKDADLGQIIKILNNHYSLYQILTNNIIVFKNKEIENILTFICNKNDLFIEDLYIPKENRKQLKIKKIGNYDIYYAIHKIKSYFECEVKDSLVAKIFAYPNILKSLGLIDDDYNISIEINGKDEVISFTNISDIINHDLFYKKHNQHSILSELEPIETRNEKYLTENLKQNYALDSATKILKMICEILPSQKDKESFKSALNTFNDLSNIESGTDEYVDWMIISSYFLFCERERQNICEGFYPEIERTLITKTGYFLDEYNNTVGKIGVEFYQNEIETEKYIQELKNENISAYDIEIKRMQELLKKGIKTIKDSNEPGKNLSIINQESNTIDYKKLITNIRNSLAHSSYEVINEEYIRLYNFEEDTNEYTFNIKLHKDIIIKIIKESILYCNLKDNFIISNTIVNDFGARDEITKKTKEQLTEYLKARFIIKFTKYDLKPLTEDEYNNYKLDNYNLLKRFIQGYDYHTSLDELEIKFQNLLKYVDFNISGYVFEEEDIDEIIEDINQYGNYFYELSYDHQKEIVALIYKNHLSKTKSLATPFEEIISSKGKSQGSLIDNLDKTSTNIFELSNYIKILLLSFLNSVLVYPLNNNKINIDTLNIHKFMKINANIIKEKKQREIVNIRQKIKKNKGILKNAKKSINNIQDNHDIDENIVLIQQDKILSLELMINQLRVEEQEIINYLYRLEHNEENIDNKILDHLRNSLAHGNISFSNFNIYNISECVIRFEDYDKNKKTFEGFIKLEDLLICLQDNEYLNNLYLNNKNFNHK